MENEPRGRSPAERTSDARTRRDVGGALVWKRAGLTQELKELDAAISRLQEEYSTRLGQLQARKRPLEDALYHVEALLRLEGQEVETSARTGGGVAMPAAVAAASVTDAVVSLLEELHRPMHYKDIAARLQAGGTYVPGRDPAATLLSRMSRDTRFKRIKKRGTYGLSTWRARNPRFQDVLAHDRAASVRGLVMPERQGRQVFLFRQPWSQVSLFALGVYGRG